MTSSEGPVCPYCQFSITADEDRYYDEENYTSEECPECGKEYSVQVIISTEWSTQRKPR